MKILFVLALFFLLAPAALVAQDTIPHLTGNITLSVKKGTIACDVVLSNMPRLTDYFIRLNSGMNIRYIKNAETGSSPLNYDRSSYDTLSSGESSAYFIPAYNASRKYLPHAIRFNYTGKFPVYNDTAAAADWRGNIAFNGSTLRADGIQSAWSPILYDVKTDKRYENVTYNLNITCEDCAMIYLNGSTPVKGSVAKVKSNTPQDLTLFAGDYKSTNINGTYFLNPDAAEAELVGLEKLLQSYKILLANETGIPYKGNAVYVQTTPVSKNNSWLFASYPTIVKIGWNEGMKTYLNKEEGPDFLKYMSHELAHYYFGTVRSFNSAVGDMISEGFAEFLSMKVAKNLISESLYRSDLERKVRAMGNFVPMPVSKLRSAADYKDRELYSYYYAPLLFSAVEKEIGENNMRQWIKSVLEAPATFTDYDFFKKTLAAVVADAAKMETLRRKYFESDESFINALQTLALKSDAVAAASGEPDAVKTYYYFFFARPIIDGGSSQNNVIVHTAVKQITSTRAELNAMAKPVFQQLAAACTNEAGCTSDFNTYDSKETADAALQRWLTRHNKSGKLKVISL